MLENKRVGVIVNFFLIFQWSAGRPGQVAAAKNVYMQMIDCLTAVGSDIDDNPKPVLGQTECSCGMYHCLQEPPQQESVVWASIQKVGQRPLRNDQEVRRRLRRGVAKSHRVIVFVENVGGYFAANDFAEDCL